MFSYLLNYCAVAVSLIWALVWTPWLISGIFLTTSSGNYLSATVTTALAWKVVLHIIRWLSRYICGCGIRIRILRRWRRLLFLTVAIYHIFCEILFCPSHWRSADWAVTNKGFLWTFTSWVIILRRNAAELSLLFLNTKWIWKWNLQICLVRCIIIFCI